MKNKKKQLSLKNLPEVFYYEKDFDISADGYELEKLMEFLNLSHIGNKRVNGYDKNKKLVALYTPEQEKPLKEVHWKANAGRLVALKIGVDKNMNLISIERA